MNKSTFTERATLVLVGALFVSASAYAQSSMQPGSMTGSAMPGMAGIPVTAPAGASRATEASASFAREWKSALEAMMLSMAQREKLALALQTASQRLSDNWGAIENFRKLAGNSSGDTQARYRRRIEIEFGERELIISETESELRTFLGEDQVGVVLTAAFHGVAPNHSGSMDSMPMGGMGRMATKESAEMRIGEFAGILNADFRAVSLDLIIDDLSSH